MVKATRSTRFRWATRIEVLECNPVARASASRSCCRPNRDRPGSFRRMPAHRDSSNRTGTFPTFSSSVISCALLSPRRANAVPSVGCPGERQLFLHGENSHSHAAFSLGRGSRGRMKVVSDRFISLAIDCISTSLSPRASKKYRQRIPFQRTGGKDIPLRHGQFSQRRLLIEFLKNGELPCTGRMRTHPPGMQKDYAKADWQRFVHSTGAIRQRPFAATVRQRPFDSGHRRFYASRMFFLDRVPAPDELLSDRRRRVARETARFFSSPPGTAGGFCFAPVSRREWEWAQTQVL